MAEIANDLLNSAVSEGTQVLTSLLKLMDDLANNHGRSQQIVNNDKKMVKKLLDYEKDGGTLIADVIDEKFAKTYEQLLKNQSIPYIASTIFDKETGEAKVIFSTRDKDEIAVALARKKYKAVLQQGLGEIEPDKFMEIYADQDVFSVSNLSPVEKELLSHHLADKSIEYAFDYDREKDQYTVICSDKSREELTNALKFTAFDLSGERGKAVQQTMEKELENRKRFEFNVTPVENQTIYIIDATNPSNFIAVNQNSYSYHSLQVKDGVARDLYNGQQKAYNKAQVARLADGILERPVVLTQEEMKLVESVRSDGSLKLNKDFDENFKYISQELMLRKDDLKHKQPTVELAKLDQVFGLDHLTDAELTKISAEINRLGLSHTKIVGNQLAYSLEDKERVEGIINTVVYQGDGRNHFETRCRIEGRGDIDLSDNREYLIKDMQNPSFQFELTPDHFTIYNLRKQNGVKVEPIIIDRNSKQFEETVIPLLNSMADPVILTGEETKLEASQRRELENERRGDAKAQDAKDLIIDYAEHERDNIIDLNFKIKEASPTQKEALEKINVQWPQQTYRVDRNMIEKIAEHTVEQKIVQEKARKDTKDYDMNR